MESMPYAISTQTESTQQLVPVKKVILGIHFHHANQNVLKIRTVQQIEYARVKSVSTPAQDFVVSILFAQFQTMLQVVIVSKVMRVMQLEPTIKVPALAQEDIQQKCLVN